METQEIDEKPISMNYDKAALNNCMIAAGQGVQIGGGAVTVTQKNVKLATEDEIKINAKLKTNDPVNHPSHYTSHPSGIECIEISKYYDFCIGNVFKYIWRSGLKSENGMSKDDKALEDLKKARWYLDQEIAMREKELNKH